MATSKRIHRTTIEVELEAYRRARSALGTRGYKDTVNEALKAVDRAARLRRGASLIRSGSLELPTPEELEDIRQPRRF
jgi:Arc/MetJ family transcription regulator